MSLADFFDRIGNNFATNFENGGAQGLASLGAAIASAPRNQWGAGIAQGLGQFKQIADANKKKASLAEALKGVSGGMTPQQQQFLSALEPDQQAEILGSQLFKEKKDPSGPFAGTGFEASVGNILARGAMDPKFRDTPEYKLAVADWTKPQFVMGPNGPQIFQRSLPPSGGQTPPVTPTAAPRPSMPVTPPPTRTGLTPPPANVKPDSPGQFYNPDMHPELYDPSRAPPTAPPAAPNVTILPNGQGSITDLGVGSKPNEAQQKAGQFGQEMKFSSNVLNDEKQVGEYLSFWNGLKREVNQGWMQSGTAQRVKGAGHQWVTNMLYMKSGATAPPAEVANNESIYIPQWGDKPEAVAYKKAAREMAEAALMGATTPEQQAKAKQTVDLITARTQEALGMKPDAPKAPPKFGSIVEKDGVKYRFLGGDPSDPKKWTKLP